LLLDAPFHGLNRSRKAIGESWLLTFGCSELCSCAGLGPNLDNLLNLASWHLRVGRIEEFNPKLRSSNRFRKGARSVERFCNEPSSQ
jgi:hypothetical protein